jgi:hypothetical protein
MNSKTFFEIGETPLTVDRGGEVQPHPWLGRPARMRFLSSFLRNKTGTYEVGMLYVDNRGSGGSLDKRAYRVGARWSFGVRNKSFQGRKGFKRR